jgi:CubicO group peptidase (beta-lactamase class C family)
MAWRTVVLRALKDNCHLNRGEWHGRRLVSESWLQQSTEIRFRGWDQMRDRYHWWIGHSRSGDKFIDWIAAVGLGGQRIFIVPGRDLVVVTTAGLYRDFAQGLHARSILDDSVLSAIRD